MPHVTLLYPFRAPEAYEPAREALARVCARVAPFRLTLATLCAFPHGRGRFTVWLAPEPREPLDALHVALLAEFPDCDDTARHASGFTPHLSVGQFAVGRPIDEALAALQADWTPLVIDVASAAAIFRCGDGPFRVRERFPLGG